MPIFEYACRECGHAFETLVRSDTIPQCPHCQSQALDKQLSVFATTAESTSAAPMMPSPCASCGHPDGPGACGFH